MPAAYRALFVDVGRKKWAIEEFPLSEARGPVSLGVKLHLERYKSYSRPAYDPGNALIIGRGLLAGTRLYGVHRLVAVFKSPLTRGLHVAAMGGAAFQMALPFDAFVLEGKSKEPTAVFVEAGEGGEVRVEFEELGGDRLAEIWRGYGGERGVYALTEYLLSSRRSFFEGRPARAVVVGPASANTSMGALFSANVVGGRVDWGSEDLAARGGPGSVMLRAHGVAALAYAGRFDASSLRPRELLDPKAVGEFFVGAIGKQYIDAVLEAGAKYRYDPKLGTGGTFGGNYPHLKAQTPMFGWNMIYLPLEVRERLHAMIMRHYWEPFNKEAIETRSWKTCGEPCPLACKKVRKGRYKTDYEPYNGLGPMIGVFDLHEAEKLVELADAYGFDAIELGNAIAFVFDALSRGLLKPEEVGLYGLPDFDPRSYSVESSRRNADLAAKLIEQMAWGTNPLLRLLAEEGLRAGAKVLEILYRERAESAGTAFVDLLVCAAFGERGHITPNFYWTPGMVAPLPVLGRYWTLYSGAFLEPEEFAAKSYERAVAELMIDDLGVCRFHRGWAEKAAPRILEKFYGLGDSAKFYRRIYAEIARYQELAGALPVPWEGKKTRDYVALAAREYANKAWAEKVEREGQAALDEWWARFSSKLSELIAGGAG